MNNNYQKEFVVLYILYPNLTNPTEVLYLKKNPKQKAPDRKSVV